MDDFQLTEQQLQQAAFILGTRLQPGDLILLNGPMGAGKTTFTRALAQGLGITSPHNVCSPSFALAVDHEGLIPLRHVDLFRLQESTRDQSAAFEALGLSQHQLLLPNYVTVVEWAQYWQGIPSEHVAIQLVRPFGVVGLRTLKATAVGVRSQILLQEWQEKLPSLQTCANLSFSTK